MFHRACILSILLAALCVFSAAQRSNMPSRGNNMPPRGNDLSFPDDQPMTGLSGTVRTFDNRPAVDARIEVTNVATGQVVAATYSNPNGTFDITNIPNGNYEVSAIVGLDEAHERVELRNSGATVSLRFGRPEGAEAGDRTSVSVAQLKVPGKARSAYKKAQSAATQQKTEEANRYLAEALGVFPEYSEALTLRGVLKLDAGDTTAAAADLEHAIKADPSYSLAYVALGATYNRMSKYDDAARTIDRGIALSPMSWQAYFEMGKAQLGKGAYDVSLRQLNKAQALGPKDYPLIHLVKAHALLGMKDYPEAMAELQAYLEKAPADQTSAEARETLAKVKAFAATNPGK
jgi:Tfp pilus assembly protein PilF